MMRHLLWTDWCLLLVFGLGSLALLWSLRKPPVRSAWISLLSQPVAASALVFLFFFIGIGTMDSIRLTPAHTLLDAVLSPLGDQYEKTYSVPFALRSFSPDIHVVQGRTKEIFSRLTYPSQFLKNTEEKQHFMCAGLLHACWMSMLLTLGMALLVLRMQTYFVGRSKLNSAWISALMTFGLIVCVLISTYDWSRALHVLGTGKIGEDILYYTVKSIRTGLVIGLLTTLFMMPWALLLGIAAGYFGGLVDDIIQYIYTTLSSIPGVLLITASVLSMQTYIANHPDTFTSLAESADARLLALCGILGITSWTSLCRVLRAETLKLREMEYVSAAKVLGSGSFKIIVKHLLPNVMHLVLITLVLDFSFLVLAEAVLSYVGVGVSPMTISWGNMINAARLELARDPLVWWPVLAAFGVMFTLVLASNLFADAVRDAFDPHHVR